MSEEEQDHGAGLIHQVASPLDETLPRPSDDLLPRLRKLRQFIATFYGVGQADCEAMDRAINIVSACEAMAERLPNRLLRRFWDAFQGRTSCQSFSDTTVAETEPGLSLGRSNPGDRPMGAAQNKNSPDSSPFLRTTRGPR